MGNTQSNANVIEEEYAKYIKGQQEIINSQQAQITQLTQQYIPPNQDKQINNKPLNTKKVSKLEMILDIFNLDKDYDEISLKKAYIKLAYIHHPDKGGKPDNFKKIQVAYKLLLKGLSEKDNDKDHQQLKDENSDYLSQQRSNNLMNTNLSEKFDNNIFNKIYEENRQKTIFDDGYGQWMKDNNEDESNNKPNDILKNSFNKQSFNNEFMKQKQQKSKNDRTIIEYSEPTVDISYRGKDSITLLGQDKIKDFSGESSSGLAYRDYKDAYTNSCLIDIDSVDISKRTKNIKEKNIERKNISYTMDEEDIKKQKSIELQEKKKEKERVKRMNQFDQNAFSTYDAIHRRMIGR